MSLTLTNIPRIMRHQGWTKGPALLERWFNRLAKAKPDYSEPPDTTTISMNWVLTFARARSVYDLLMRERIWANPRAQLVVAEVLRRNGYLDGAPHSFGNLSLPAERLDHDYINHRDVSYGPTDLDDLMAALGRFVFRVLVAGSVRPATPPLRPGHYVTITEVGVYVWDSFDFEGEQFLGFWDDADNSVSLADPTSGTPVTNADFRNHRARTNVGGDFLIFSDIKRTTLSTPDSFVIP